MTIERRKFVLDTGLIALAAIANLPAAAARSQSSLAPAPPAFSTARAMSLSGLDFKIEGWSIRDDARINHRSITSLNSASSNGIGETVWLRVDRSWRTAWR
jgi:hypothetical protein